MNDLATTSKDMVMEYFEALSAHAKPDELVSRYVSDPSLREHIRQAEAAFPSYELIAEQTIAEGDTVAVRGTMKGTHTGEFAGLPPTGRKIAVDVMLFYRVADGRIAEHWMQWDMGAVMRQLTS